MGTTVIVKKMFSREWGLTTLLVILGAGLCIRLGIWQLDRLEQRKAFNSHVQAMWNSPPIILAKDSLTDSLVEMEYRSIIASGEYDFSNQVALRNQYYQDLYGYHLLTPLVIGQGIAVVVDRGWIPSEKNEQPENWQIYNTERQVEISGIIRVGQVKPDLGGRPDPTLSPGQVGLDYWNNVNLERLDQQMPYELLDIYIQLDFEEGSDSFPIPYQPEIELTEGPHLGYAGQWFVFATLLFAGYPYLIRKRENLA